MQASEGVNLTKSDFVVREAEGETFTPDKLEALDEANGGADDHRDVLEERRQAVCVWALG